MLDQSLFHDNAGTSDRRPRNNEGEKIKPIEGKLHTMLRTWSDSLALSGSGFLDRCAQSRAREKTEPARDKKCPPRPRGLASAQRMLGLCVEQTSPDVQARLTNLMSRSPSPLLQVPYYCTRTKKEKEQDRRVSRQIRRSEGEKKKHDLIKRAYIACRCG